MNHHIQSEALKAILAAQKPKPRWRVRLERALPNIVDHALNLLGTLVIIGCLIATILALASRAGAQPLDLDRLLPALEQVESGGRADAVGDNGKALGVLQIWSVIVQDVNRAKGTSYTHADALDPEKARAICRAYLSIYCTERRLGRKPTMEDAARIWNGGPNGYKKASTEKYWQKVAANL